MKAFLFCTSCINVSPEHQFRRYDLWLKYHLSIMEDLNAEKIFIINDGLVDATTLFPIFRNNLPDRLNSKVNFIEFENQLGRRSTADFPGWWRSFLFSIQIAKKYGYQKIIHIESDFFVISARLKSYISNLNNGWASMYSDYYEFPETGIQIICEDAFQKLESTAENVSKLNCQVPGYIEEFMPFTDVEKHFLGDRLGEEDILCRWMTHYKDELTKLDYIGQIKTLSSLNSLMLRLQKNELLTASINRNQHEHN